MAISLDAGLRKELIAALEGGNAHARFEDVAAKFPAHLRDKKVGGENGEGENGEGENGEGENGEGENGGLPYSAWQLLEHIRIAQNDILRFSTNYDGSYRELHFPDDYWPKSAAPPSTRAWQKSVAAVLADRDAMVKLIGDPRHDLVAAFPWGDGQNLLREAILVIDHNSYHIGELLALRRLLGIWPAK